MFYVAFTLAVFQEQAFRANEMYLNITAVNIKKMIKNHTVSTYTHNQLQIIKLLKQFIHIEAQTQNFRGFCCVWLVLSIASGSFGPCGLRVVASVDQAFEDAQ